MITLRRSDERGRGEHGWLSSRHTFSFGEYYDDRFLGFRDLLVINEDRVKSGSGFPTHGHRDMEIISYVLEGALAHRDSLGNGSVLHPGEVQRMTAGTGIRHSEFNQSASEPLHFLQIWIRPEQAGLAAGYEQRAVPPEAMQDRLAVIASPDGDGVVHLHQDVRLLAARLSDGRTVEHPLEPGRHAWVQVARGAIDLAGEQLQAGDGAAISDEAVVRLTAAGPAEVLLFDLR
jgi:Pirin-related protein